MGREAGPTAKVREIPEILEIIQNLEITLGVTPKTGVAQIPKKRVCWNCGKEGHFYRECWSPKDSSYGRTRERDAYRAFLDDTSSVQNTNNEQSFNLEKQCKDLQAQLNALQKQQQESHLTQGSL